MRVANCGQQRVETGEELATWLINRATRGKCPPVRIVQLASCHVVLACLRHARPHAVRDPAQPPWVRALKLPGLPVGGLFCVSRECSLAAPFANMRKLGQSRRGRANEPWRTFASGLRAQIHLLSPRLMVIRLGWPEPDHRRSARRAALDTHSPAVMG
jgi:hypothetical protein